MGLAVRLVKREVVVRQELTEMMARLELQVSMVLMELLGHLE
jgi:hypothetical protein